MAQDSQGDEGKFTKPDDNVSGDSSVEGDEPSAEDIKNSLSQAEVS
jgi:hypothetical protein